MLTFLKKLGQVLAKAVTIEMGLGPVLAPFLGSAGPIVNKVENDLTQIAQLVTTVEAVIQTPGSGAAKLTAAIPLVTSVISSSELLVGKKVANQALFTQACTEYTQATVDLLNSLDASAVKTT